MYACVVFSTAPPPPPPPASPGPGFINIRLNKDWLAARLTT